MRKWIDNFSQWLVGFGIEPYLHILVTIVIAMLIARVCYFTGSGQNTRGLHWRVSNFYFRLYQGKLG